MGKRAEERAEVTKLAKLHDLEVEEFLVECVRIYPEALNEEFVRIPSDIAYWSERHAVALKAHLVAKLVFDRTEAETRTACRQALLDQNAKVTESMVDAAVEQSEALQEARQELINAEVEKVRLSGVLDALRAKRDMLISLGAAVRAEMASDPSLRERMRGAGLVGGQGGM